MSAVMTFFLLLYFTIALASVGSAPVDQLTCIYYIIPLNVRAFPSWASDDAEHFLNIVHYLQPSAQTWQSQPSVCPLLPPWGAHRQQWLCIQWLHQWDGAPQQIYEDNSVDQPKLVNSLFWKVSAGGLKGLAHLLSPVNGKYGAASWEKASTYCRAVQYFIPAKNGVHSLTSTLSITIGGMVFTSDPVTATSVFLNCKWRNVNFGCFNLNIEVFKLLQWKIYDPWNDLDVAIITEKKKMLHISY